VEIPPKTRVEINGGLFSVAYIHSKALPGARIGIHSPAANETHLIGAMERGNIWIYGTEIMLAGWLRVQNSTSVQNRSVKGRVSSNTIAHAPKI